MAEIKRHPQVRGIYLCDLTADLIRKQPRVDRSQPFPRYAAVGQDMRFARVRIEIFNGHHDSR